MADKKTFRFRPNWKYFFVSYVLSVIAIPLAGIGLIALYFIRKKHNSIQYKITDDRIISYDQKYEHNVDLVDIKSISVKESWLQDQLDIATLVLHTSASTMELLGVKQPSQLKDILEQAIETEKKHQKQRQKTQRQEPSYGPGKIDKIEYLTGLWQQGLISEEDYKSERKQLE